MPNQNLTDDEFIRQMTVGTLPEDAQSGTAEEAFRALVEGGQGYFGLDAARPGTEAYRTGQGLANLPVIGMPSAAVRAAGAVRGAASDALARFNQGRANPNAMMATAYHGSGNLFGELDPSKAKSGVGEQRYGAGAGYAAESRPVAEGFIGAEAQALRASGGMDPKLEFIYDLVSQKRPDSEILDLVAAKYGKGITFDEAFATLQKAKDLTRGYLYKGDIPDEILPSFLDWNKSLAQQPDVVKKLLRKDPLVKESVSPESWNKVSSGIIQKSEGKLDDLTGDSIYKYISLKLGSDQAATDYLNKLGVRGIRYADPGSKGLGRAPSGTSNFVVFNPSDYRIESVNDRPLQEMVKQSSSAKALPKNLTKKDIRGIAEELETSRGQLAELVKKYPQLREASVGDVESLTKGQPFTTYRGISLLPGRELRSETMPSTTLDPNVALGIIKEAPVMMTKEGFITSTPVLRQYPGMQASETQVYVPSVIQQIRERQPGALEMKIPTRSGEKMTVEDVFKAVENEKELLADVSKKQPQDVMFNRYQGGVGDRYLMEVARRVIGGDYPGGEALVKEIGGYQTDPEGLAKEFDEFAKMVKSRVVKKAEGGEVTNEDFIQQMITGTPLAEQEEVFSALGQGNVMQSQGLRSPVQSNVSPTRSEQAMRAYLEAANPRVSVRQDPLRPGVIGAVRPSNPDEILLSSNLRQGPGKTEEVLLHEMEHSLSLRGGNPLGATSKFTSAPVTTDNNYRFDLLYNMGDKKIENPSIKDIRRMRESGEGEKKRLTMIQNFVNNRPRLEEFFGRPISSAYFDPNMLKAQVRFGTEGALFSEQIADLSALEQLTGKSLTKDKEMRKLLFPDDKSAEIYDAITGYRQTRLDSKDLPPYTPVSSYTPVSPEKPGMFDWLKSRLGMKEGGEVTDDEFIQQMTVGTPPTDQGPRPYDQTAVAQFADYLRAPVDLAQTAVRGTVGAVVGPAYGVYKGLTGGKYGTPEGVREASEAGGQLMQRITGEPQSQAARDVLEFIGKKAADYKLAPMPQLMTLPVPGPGAAQYPLQAAKTQAEDIALRAVRSQTQNPDITASQLYNAMLGKQAPGAAITKPMGPTTAPVQAPQTPLGFYSAVEDTVLKLPQEKGTAQQLLAQISKAPGVKDKEIEATGLAEFLRSKGAAPVTKQEIQDFLANNRVQVDEVVLGKGQDLSLEAKQRMGEAENRMIELDNQLAPYFENLQRPDIDPYGTFVRLRGPVARKAAAGDAEAMAEIDALNLPPNIKQLLLEFGEQKNEYQKYAKQSRRIEKPRFNRYNTPGGENAREIYLTLPFKEPAVPKGYKVTSVQYDDGTYRYFAETPTTRSAAYKTEQEANAELQRMTEALKGFRKNVGTLYTVPFSHSVSQEADTNRLAHIFLDDRTDAQGNKTLFVQELQSDWAQEGRNRGFKNPPDPTALEAAKNKVSQTEQALRQKFEDLFNRGERAQDHPERLAALEQVTQAREELQTLLQESRLPPAPFVTNTEDWLNLALKRVIKEAVDSGADNVAFIKGEQAASKYSLSTVLDNIEVMPFHPLHAFKGRLVDLKRKDGGIIELKVDDTGKVLNVSDSVFFREFANKPLSDIVGKEMSEKIMAVKPGEESVQFSAKDMEVGGQGMKAFYDNIVPKTAKKLLEKLGSKIETIDLGRTKSRETWVQGRENPFRAEQDINEPYEGRVKIVNTETGESRVFNTRDEADEYVAEALGHNVDQIHLGFKITPEMREIVKGQGLPQFAAGGEVTNFIRAHA